MKLSSYLRRTLAACILLIAFTIIALAAYALTIKTGARHILKDIYELHVGVSTDANVRRVVAKHRSHLSWTGCEADRCFYFFEVTNRWLSWIRVEPGAVFQAWVMVESGKVRSLHAEIQRDTKVFATHPSGGIVDEFLTYPDNRFRDDAHYSFSSTPVGKPYLWVTLDKAATPAQRSRAYALSLTCLVKPGGGCDLPCDYLPLAWKDWEAELTSEGWDFGHYYPTHARCK